MVRRDPHHFGHKAARWTLARLLASCDWLRLKTLGGLWQLLHRLGLGWKGSRSHIHSPDPLYAAKRAEIARVVAEVEANGGSGKMVLVYLDEVTIYRQPSLAHAWEEGGKAQAKAQRSQRSDTVTRIVAALNHHSGQVTYLRGSRIGVVQLIEFYQQLKQAYPQAERIYVVQDNWPVHFHPDVLVGLQPQSTPFEWYRPGNWPSQPSEGAKRKWGELHLPIELVVLPTYASWLNPIEKLWRYLKQEVLHLHRLSEELEALRGQIDHFLDQFQTGSNQLLRYVGLYTD